MRGELKETADPADARSKPLSLTGKGRRTLASLHDFGRRQVSGALAHLSEAERRKVSEGLNLYARADHIVPPAACACLGRYVGSRDYTACAIDTGHIGMYVSRKAREEIPERIISWLKARGGGARPRPQ